MAAHLGHYRGLVGPQSLDDPPFRALDLVGLEADDGEIGERLPRQMVGHEADAEWLEIDAQRLIVTRRRRRRLLAKTS